MTQAMHDYLLMGGYAGFIWPAYGVAALVLIAFAFDSWRRVHQATTALRRLESEVAARGGNKTRPHTVPGKPDQASNQPTPNQPTPNQPTVGS